MSIKLLSSFKLSNRTEKRTFVLNEKFTLSFQIRTRLKKNRKKLASRSTNRNMSSMVDTIGLRFYNDTSDSAVMINLGIFAEAQCIQ